MLVSIFRSFLIIAFLSVMTNVALAEIEFTEQEKAWIKAHPIIYHGYEPNWPPFEMYKDGEYKGIIGDYIEEMERETGLDIRPIPDITWEETLSKLKTGEVDFTFCAGITDERKKYLAFTKPYLELPMIIVTRKDYQFVSGLADLRNKTIALPKSYYTAELIQRDHPEINLILTNGTEEALRMVSLGKADAFVGNLVVVSYYIENSGFSNLKIAAPTNYDKAYIGLAARKDWPELVSIAQKVFDNMTYEEKNAILQKWVFVRYEFGVNMRTVWKISIYVAVAIILIIGGILFWNETLRKEIKHRHVVEEELAITLREITAQNNERKTLLNEIHHRIKNNLHMVSGLLKLQALESGSREVENQLNEAVERVRSIAVVHDRIYKSEDAHNLNMNDFIKPIADEIIGSFYKEGEIEIMVDCDVNLKNSNPMASIALIMNELVTNSLKYAFSKTEKPQISIKVFEENGVMNLVYSDNGTWKKPSEGNKGFGISLIDIFTEQLEGSYATTHEEGTTYYFAFTNFYAE